MEPSDSGEFARRLVAVGEIFDAKLSPVKLALYFEALRDLPFAQVAQAINQAAKLCTFFPKPAELRALAAGDAETASETAWLAFRGAMAHAGGYASLLVYDAALAETIVSMFGSWAGACRAEFSPEMWASKRKEFERVYRVYHQRGIDGARYLPGHAEGVNARDGHSLKFVPVHALGGDGQLVPLSLEESHVARAQIAATSHGLRQLAAAIDHAALPAPVEHPEAG